MSPSERLPLLALLIFTGPVLGGDPGPVPGPFLETYCVGCHGPDVRKAGLRLDTLGTDLRDERAMATWVRVHDQLASGAMPPKTSDQPPPREREAATRDLHRALHAASLARQQDHGRAAVRRLNATEYENTVRELVGTNVPLRDLLPEDGSAAGFDNVGSALELSASHLLRYQEAADKAVRSAVPDHPPVPFRDRRTGREVSAKGPNFKQTLDRSCVLDGDALVIYSKLPRYGLCSTAAVPADGRYRVRMSVSAVGAEGKGVPAAFQVVGTGREDPVTFAVQDVAPGRPQVVELDVDLARRQAFVVNVLTTWDIRGFKKPIAEYTGPGVRVEWLEIDGPVGAFPPPSYERLFAGVPLKPRSVAKALAEGKPPPKIAENRNLFAWQADPLVPVSADLKTDAERLIRSYAARAFRRPVPDDVTARVVARVHEKLDAKAPFFEAMTFGYTAILSSPHFLLLAEPGPKLDDFALACRLSYFLWSGPPDEELRALATKGELSRPDALRAQVERLLGSPKAARFTENFTGQWLDLRKIDATIPDPHLYGDFDGLLLWAMPRETRAFFDAILKDDRSALEFVDSDWSMLNERLAAHYGVPDVVGNELRKVALPPGSHRGGVMTHASVLKVTADGTRTSPVLRGTWVLDRILGTPPAPPPPDVPALEPDIRGATTIRQQLDKHRTLPACATCHVHIDPPGFALEAFDPIGGFRDFYRATTGARTAQVKVPFHTNRPIYRGPAVDPSGQTADDRAFADLAGYKKLLLADPDQIARNLAGKLLVYATGADLQFADREAIEEIVGRAKAKNYGFRTLVHEVVQSRPFRNK